MKEIIEMAVRAEVDHLLIHRLQFTPKYDNKLSGANGDIAWRNTMPGFSRPLKTPYVISNLVLSCTRLGVGR